MKINLPVFRNNSIDKAYDAEMPSGALSVSALTGKKENLSALISALTIILQRYISHEKEGIHLNINFHWPMMLKENGHPLKTFGLEKDF